MQTYVANFVAFRLKITPENSEVSHFDSIQKLCCTVRYNGSLRWVDGRKAGQEYLLTYSEVYTITPFLIYPHELCHKSNQGLNVFIFRVPFKTMLSSH